MPSLLSFVLDQEVQFRRARLPSLYSDFSLQRYTNPDGYAANVVAWEDVLMKATFQGLTPGGPDGPNIFSLMTGEELLQELESREWGRPLALGTVFDEAVSQYHMIPIKDFLNITPSTKQQQQQQQQQQQGWYVWPSQVFSWGLHQLELIGRKQASSKLQNGQYVIRRNVEKAASQILSYINTRSTEVNKIYSIDLFRKEVEKALHLKSDLTKTDLLVILTFLTHYKRAIVYDQHVVKFTTSGEAISSQDRTISSLKTLMAELTPQTELLKFQIAMLKSQAQAAMKNQDRPEALRVLRLKKLRESTLAQRQETLSTLEEIYSKIEQAVDHVSIVRVMEASTGVLRHLNLQAGKTESLQSMVEELLNEMNKVDDVSKLIEVAGNNSVVDDAALDEELKSLKEQVEYDQDMKYAQETQKRLASLSINAIQGLTKEMIVEDAPGLGTALPVALEELGNSSAAEATKSSDQLLIIER